MAFGVTHFFVTPAATIVQSAHCLTATTFVALSSRQRRLAGACTQGNLVLWGIFNSDICACGQCGIDGTKFRTYFVKTFVSIYRCYHPQNISRVAPPTVNIRYPQLYSVPLRSLEGIYHKTTWSSFWLEVQGFLLPCGVSLRSCIGAHIKMGESGGWTLALSCTGSNAAPWVTNSECLLSTSVCASLSSPSDCTLPSSLTLISTCSYSPVTSSVCIILTPRLPSIHRVPNYLCLHFLPVFFHVCNHCLSFISFLFSSFHNLHILHFVLNL